MEVIFHGPGIDYIRLSGYIHKMQQTISVCKALAEPTRLRILALLDQSELCVCTLVSVLQAPQSTVSRHLALLKAAGWICERRQGVWMYYRLTRESSPLQAALCRDILVHLAGLAEVRRDRKRLARYLLAQGINGCG